MPPESGHATTWRTRIVPAVTYVLIAVGVLALAVRFWRSHDIAALAIIAFVPYLMAAPVLALVVAMIRRRWLTSAIAAVVVAACAGTQLPHYLADEAPRDSVEVTVMTVNLWDGRADPAAVVRAIRTHDVDLLMLTEITWARADNLVAAGLFEELPYYSGRPGVSAEGTGLFSRYPMQVRDVFLGFTFIVAAGLVQVPGAAMPVHVLAFHLPGPLQDSFSWRHDVAQVPPLLRSIPRGPVIVGGDFNATPDNPWFRDIVDVRGFENTIDQAGSGPIPTYSAQHPVPLLAIDHVLTRGAVATRVEPVSIPGTDHRGIVATVAIPRTAPDAAR